eukprot:Rmarinus@m.28034
MPSPADSPKKRVKNVVLVKPIVTGSVAFWLGKKAQERKSHRWSVYLRGVHGEDLSYFIRKVIFQLHHTFTDSQRVLLRPPFEVEEYGWGEFEIGIKIYFVDPVEKPVQLYHSLKLYPSHDIQLTTKKPVISEYYDELVFQDPSAMLYERLMTGPTVMPPPHPFAQYWLHFDEQHEKKAVVNAEKKVQSAIKQLQARLKTSDAEIQKLNAALPPG